VAQWVAFEGRGCVKTARKIKQACLTAAQAGGLFRISASSPYRNDRALVLGYHGLSLVDEHLWNPSLYIDADSFGRKMKLLRSTGCTVLDLGESLHLTKAGKLPKRAVVLTFDDGTYDFYKVAWPILREYGYPATLYLNTYYVENQVPCAPGIWSYMLWKAKTPRVDAREIVGENGIFNVADETGRSQAIQALMPLVDPGTTDASTRNVISKKLADITGVDFDALCSSRIHQLLRPEEVRELANDGVSVQMHMHRHNSPAAREAYIGNLEANRQRITALTGSVPQHFCYPSGRYSQERVNWLRDYGVSSATTCEPGLFSAETETLLIPRLIDSRNVPDIVFESWLVGIGALLSDSGRWLRRTMHVSQKNASKRA
jgi:peptidoglycan/xylan/chitin deacetylase (PgdA/CDA1 family)